MNTIPRGYPPLTIGTGIAISPSGVVSAPVGIPYSVTLAADGATPPYTWSKVGFELPDGITLSSTSVLSGAANVQQTENTGYQFTVKATDSAARVAYKSFFIDLAGALSTVTILAASAHWF